MREPAQESASRGNKPDDPILPVEVEIYINSDGSVTFADLESSIVAVARRLNPDQSLACDVSANQQVNPRNPASGGENNG